MLPNPVDKSRKLTRQYKEEHQQHLRYRLSHVTPKHCLVLVRANTENVTLIEGITLYFA